MNQYRQEGSVNLNFVVTHDILEVDRLVFPGQSGDQFFQPDKWPSSLLEVLEDVGKLANKHKVRLMRGEVRDKEGLTYLWVSSPTKKHVQKFYDAFQIVLDATGGGHKLVDLTISEDDCREYSDDLKTDIYKEINSIKKILS